MADKTRQTVFDRLPHCHFVLWCLVLLSSCLAFSLCLVIFFYLSSCCLVVLFFCCHVVLLSSSLVVLFSCYLLLLLSCCLVVLLFCCLAVLLPSSLLLLLWGKLKVTFQFSSLRGIFNGFEQDQWDSSSITTVKQVKLETSITRQHLKIYFKDWG